MKDLFDAISSRIKAPYFGYAMLSFIALNWRGLFLLMTTPGSPQDRLSAFDSVTNQYTLFIFPLLAGVLVALATPWIHFCFGFIAKKPSFLIDNLYLESEHNKTIRQAELEQSRANLFAVKEKELIERAKRDDEVANIEDDTTKNKLAGQLEKLRQERDQLSAQLKNQNQFGTPTVYQLSNEALNLLTAAAEDERGTILRLRAIGSRAIQAGGKLFGNNSSREFAIYDSALAELHKRGLVKSVGSKGDSFELTGTGWGFS